MAKVKIGKRVSETAWGEVDKPALGQALAARWAAGEAGRAVLREAYAFVPAEAFGKDADGQAVFYASKGWAAHHELDGDELVLNRNGVIGAAQALGGARSEPSLDEAALAQAKRHIRRHYRALKMDAPEGLQESAARNPADCGTERLEELTKGSLEYEAQQVRAAFMRQFEGEFEDEGRWLYVEECFADHVIVRDGELPEDEYWRVAFSRDAEGGFVFVEREEWELVELGYQAGVRSGKVDAVPAGAVDGSGRTRTDTPVQEARPARKPAAGHSTALRSAQGAARFVERLAAGVELVEETAEAVTTKAGGLRRIRAKGITAGVVNRNGRRYSAQVLQAAVEELRDHLHESAGQGRLVPLLGEVEHPSDKPSGRPNLLETVVRWSNATFDGRQVLLEGVLLETAKGKDLLAVLAGGVRPGISQRGYGRSRAVEENGQRVEEMTELTITGYDVVMEPSDPEAEAELQESGSVGDRPELVNEGDEEMDAEKLMELIKANPQLFKGIVAESVKEMTDAQRAALEETVRKALGVAGDADLGKALAEAAAAKKQVDADAKAKGISEAVTEACKGLAYGKLNETFATELREGVQDAGEVAGRAAALHKRYDQMLSAAKLAGMGRLDVVGSVLEREAGVPEYARHSHELTEALVRTGYIQPWDSRKPKNRNEQLAAKYLEKFDRQYARELRKEAAAFAEAETAAGLNIPYGVSRTILAAVWPTLVATGLFDVDTTEQAPVRVYYEVFAEESGKHVAITREEVTSDLNVWVSLAHKRLQPGTVVVENHANNVTYTEGTDYIIDYTNGAIKELATIGETNCHVSYHYDALREGEGSVIQQAKMTLSYGLMDVQADRLATQINNEAVVFARSQLGWDATTRTLVNLINEVRRRIDADLMFDALSAALGVASNSGGTWTAASDPIIDLVSYVGLAKDKIAKRYYTPTGILVSSTIGDKLANWDGFTAAGKRPDADLLDNGYLGRLKGLPVFTSTEFSDAYVLVFNRQMVIHRVYIPMAMKGPFPTYDQATAKLIAADQWYAEEYNGTLVPVAEKAATVKIS
jgi:hypothetical protein